MNDKTLRFYDQNAQTYAPGTPSGYTLEARDKFASALPVSAHILELGCGGGHDAQAFIDAGFDVTLLMGQVSWRKLPASVRERM